MIDKIVIMEGKYMRKEKFEKQRAILKCFLKPETKLYRYIKKLNMEKEGY